MSASEKLKALEKEGAFGRWSIYEEERDSGGETYTERWIAEDDYPSLDGSKSDGVLLSLEPDCLTANRARLIVELRNALPQIVAVVEAAERSHDHRQAMVGGVCETCAALAALEEVLTNPQGKD